MNKTYRSMWNAALGAFVAAPETARACGKKAGGSVVQLYATNTAIDAVSATANAGWNVTTAATGTGTVSGTTVQNIAPGSTATYTAGNNIAITQNGAEVQIATSMTPTFTSVTTGSLTATGPTTLTGGTTIGGSLTVNPGTTVDMGGNVITNVAPGVAGTDAVNVNQLNSGIAAANAYTDARVNSLQNSIERNARMLSGGIAASAAMAVVTPVEPGRYHVSGAVAGYNGQAGIGINLLKRSDNGQTTLHGGLGWGSGGGKAIVRVGFGFSFD